MPRKLRTMKFLSPLPFLAMFFIAVGMPALHPAVHNHAGIHQHRGHGDAADFPFYGAAESGECPICQFLATNHLQQAGQKTLVFAPPPAPSLPLPYRAVNRQICHVLPASRAPPKSNS